MVERFSVVFGYFRRLSEEFQRLLGGWGEFPGGLNGRRKIYGGSRGVPEISRGGAGSGGGGGGECEGFGEIPVGFNDGLRGVGGVSKGI